MLRRFSFLAACILATAAVHAELVKPANARWEAVPDDVYLQETSVHVTTEAPLTAVAAFDGAVFVGDAKGVLRLEGERLVRDKALPGGVTRLKVLDEALYAATPEGLWEYDGSAWARIAGEPVADMCLHLGGIVVASGNGVYRVEGDGLAPIIEDLREPVEGVASYSGTIYFRHAKRLGLIDRGEAVYEIADWGAMRHGITTRDMLSVGSRLVVATDEGLAVLRGMTWHAVTGAEGLPYEDTTALAEGFDGDLWIGTMRGAIRNAGDGYAYYGYGRWLPHDKVNGVAYDGTTVYVATDGGLGVIAYEPYTLLKKAAWYERWLEEWGMKRIGFTHSLGKRDGEWLRSISDNDIGFSAHYLVARCFEYAVTKDPAVKAEAIDMMKTVKWSEEASSIPGYPARSMWVVGEKGLKADHGSGGLPAEWHPTEDGLFEWKGDTSSDETDAQLYAVSLFLELVATEDSPERRMAIEHLHRVFGHIVDNGWVLRDVDGQPTRWARWDPEYLQRPYGYYARGLNGMGALSYVTTAYHFTGDEKFKAGKDQLIEWGYHNEVVRQKLTFTPDYYTDFDDRLAFLVYFPLLRYETDPDLMSLWLRSLERSWEVKRMEGVPWYNYIYGAITGNDCEHERSADHLREWPLDLVNWSMFNSHRDDIRTPAGYRSYAERLMAISPRESGPKRVNRDWTALDFDGRGNSVTDPACWLEQYWMGRYYGFIAAPTATDPAVLTVPKRGLHLGAEPYDGPARPPLEYER